LAFELFEDLSWRYEQDESKKRIASYLVTNANKVHSIVGNTEASKHIAREDGDYEELSNLAQSLRDLQVSDFFAHTIKSIDDIHALYRNYRRGSIIETPYVREKIDEVMESLEGDIPQPVMLIGVHGAGKTELARHMARTRFGVEAIEIPGSEDLDKRDFEGRYKLEAADLEGFVNFLHAAGIRQVTLAGKDRKIDS
jgi:transcriptional regulator with AAA-type ATPase domain